MNKILLHVEGLVVLLLAVSFYVVHDFNWWLFILLLFTPDLAILGYKINVKIGAIIYNIFHTYILSLLLVLFGLLIGQSLLLAIGIIWTAHIGMDRACGFGLKYPTSFKDTHLHHV